MNQPSSPQQQQGGRYIPRPEKSTKPKFVPTRKYEPRLWVSYEGKK